MNSAVASCISSWVRPPRACPSAHPHAAALRRREKGPNWFDGQRGSGQHLSGRLLGGCNRKLITRSSARPDSLDLPTAWPTVERTAQDELERIKAFRVPDFVCPYPAKRNQFADNAKPEVYRWMEEYIPLHEVYRTPEELQSFYKSDLAEWAAMSYVDCGEKELAWLMKLTVLAYPLDDVFADECSPEKSMSSFLLELNVMIMWSFPDDEQLYKTVVELLDLCEVAERTETLNYLHSKLAEARLKPGTLYDTSSSEVHWVCKSFGYLWAELRETTPNAFSRRWARHWQTFVLESVREIMNRKYKVIPSVDNLVDSREHSVGFWFLTVLFQFAEKTYIPDEVQDCPEMKRFLSAAFKALILDNDLWSFQKEAPRGDIHNMVVLLSHAQECSYAEAGMKTHQMMLGTLAEMETAIADLEKATPPEYQQAISIYIRGLRNLYAGTHYVYVVGTDRYAQSVLGNAHNNVLTVP